MGLQHDEALCESEALRPANEAINRVKRYEHSTRLTGAAIHLLNATSI